VNDVNKETIFVFFQKNERKTGVLKAREIIDTIGLTIY